MLLSILFLVGTLMCSIGSTQTQQGNQPDNISNACCQCAAGIPGIPGQSGHNGLPGRDGIRGEPGLSIKGEKGDNGDRDQPEGPEGPAGGIGPRGLQGLPGKIGPQGLPGNRGSNGQSGFGEKGEKGESGHTRKSAFTAIKTSRQSGVSGDLITFDDVQANINNHFNLETSKFTCQVSGTYVFMFSIGVAQNTHPVVWLVKNGNLVVGAYLRTSGASDHDMGGNTAIMDLVEGDMVWIQFGHYDSVEEIHSNINRYVTLSGYLLYEI